MLRHLKFTVWLGAVVLAAALLPAQTFAQTSNDTAPPGSGALPSYPGIGPDGVKAEADMGNFKFRMFGTLLVNVNGSDGAIFGQDVPLWTIGGNVTYPDGTVGRAADNHDLVITARQSVFGFAVNQTQSGSWTPGGLIEMDFFGTRPVDTVQPLNRVLNQPRLRLAFFQLEHEGMKFVFGQDKAILAPLDPISLSHVGIPYGGTAGNLWAWLPQARVDFKRDMLLVQFGILKSLYQDGRLEGQPTASTSVDVASTGLGERTTQPFWEGRVAIMPKILGNSSTFGVSAHYGKEKVGVDRDLNSWAVAFDGSAAVDKHVVIRGEAYTGTNLITFQGGIQQGVALQAAPVATNPPLKIQTIDDRGGWGEITVLPTSKDAIYFGVSTDMPKQETLLPGSTRSENTSIWASYFRRLTNTVTLAAEWSQWRFKTVTFTNNVITSESAAGVANVLNVAVAYQF